MKRFVTFLVSAFVAASLAASDKPLIKIIGTDSEDASLTLAQMKEMNSSSCKVFDPWLGYKEYRGISLKELLDHFKVQPDVKEVKVFDKGGNSVVIRREDADRYPIMLAYEERNVDLPPCHGGTVKLVFPTGTNPELSKTYPGESWIWYVKKVELVRQVAGKSGNAK